MGRRSTRSGPPENRPEWIETVELKYPSGRSAHEIVLRDAAQLAWVVNLAASIFIRTPSAPTI